MDFRRHWITLLCLPALLAPSGFTWVLCLCDDMPSRGCCAASDAAPEPDSCCEQEARGGDETAAELGAPCPSCHAFSTPETPPSKAPDGLADRLTHAALAYVAPTPPGFVTARVRSADVARPRVRNASPPGTAVPLRI